MRHMQITYTVYVYVPILCVDLYACCADANYAYIIICVHLSCTVHAYVCLTGVTGSVVGQKCMYDSNYSLTISPFEGKVVFID